MEYGHIARSEEDLRMAADEFEIEMGQDPPRTISAAGAKDPLDLIPEKHLLKSCRPVLIPTGEESPTVVEMRGLQDLKPHSVQGPETTLEAIQIHRARGGHDRDNITLAERFWPFPQHLIEIVFPSPSHPVRRNHRLGLIFSISRSFQDQSEW